MFNWIRTKKNYFYMLKEVHCSENTTDFCTSEWGYKELFRCCSSRKVGVGILLNNNFNLNVIKTLQDSSGRFIICGVEADGKLLTLTNIYAPNKVDPNFFDTFFDRLSCFKCDDVVIGDEFNLVLARIARTHQNALEVIQDAMENMEFCDVWRIFYPDCKRYTWRQRQPEIHCRQTFLSESIHTSYKC